MQGFCERKARGSHALLTDPRNLLEPSLTKLWPLNGFSAGFNLAKLGKPLMVSFLYPPLWCDRKPGSVRDIQPPFFSCCSELNPHSGIYFMCQELVSQEGWRKWRKSRPDSRRIFLFWTVVTYIPWCLVLVSVSSQPLPFFLLFFQSMYKISGVTERTHSVGPNSVPLLPHIRLSNEYAGVEMVYTRTHEHIYRTTIIRPSSLQSLMWLCNYLLVDPQKTTDGYGFPLALAPKYNPESLGPIWRQPTNQPKQNWPC